jgi:hypothetical protein
MIIFDIKGILPLEVPQQTLEIPGMGYIFGLVPEIRIKPV